MFHTWTLCTLRRPSTGFATLCSAWGENTLCSVSHVNTLHPEETFHRVSPPCAGFRARTQRPHTRPIGYPENPPEDHPRSPSGGTNIPQSGTFFSLWGENIIDPLEDFRDSRLAAYEGNTGILHRVPFCSNFNFFVTFLQNLILDEHENSNSPNICCSR